MCTQGPSGQAIWGVLQKPKYGSKFKALGISSLNFHPLGLCIHPFNKYLRSSYTVIGSILGAEGRSMNNTDEIPTFVDLMFWWENWK